MHLFLKGQRHSLKGKGLPFFSRRSTRVALLFKKVYQGCPSFQEGLPGLPLFSRRSTRVALVFKKV